MEIPDLVGITIDDALKELDKFKTTFIININETSAPSLNDKNKSECRVVRQRISDNIIELTVSYF